MAATLTKTLGGDWLKDAVEALALAPAPQWAGLAGPREAAAVALDSLSLPQRGDEAWRATPLAALLAHPLVPTPPAPIPMTTAISRFLLKAAAGRRLVFVDGRFAPSLSELNGMPAGATLGPASHHPELAKELQGTMAALRDENAPERDALDALHDLAAEDTMLLDLPAKAELNGPIQVLFVGGAGRVAEGHAPLVAASLMVRVGRLTEATLIEEHVSLDEPCFVGLNRVHVALGEGAVLHHARVLSESRAGVHHTRLSAYVPRDARYAVQSVALGGRLSRTEKRIRLAAKGALTKVDGLVLVGGQQLADLHTAILHESPHAESRQSFKAIAADKAVAVFDGLIYVAPGADGTDSAQQARGLLLDGSARLDIKPQLEIYADDVKAAHGAAVGQLDAEQLFYLQSRGMTAAAARKLLTYAFAAEVLESIPEAQLREQLSAVVLRQTAEGFKS